MLIRKFVPGDTRAVSKVVERSLGENYAPSLYMTVHNLWPDGFLVLEGEAGIIGFVAAVVSAPKAARVLMLAVDPDHRNRSCGSMLMDALYSSCISRGLDIVVLEVRKSNEKARLFYERQGFKVTGELKCFYTNGEDAHKMSRALLV
jgi:ribosomal-protein-alanine N-acetyltransferase